MEEEMYSEKYCHTRRPPHQTSHQTKRGGNERDIRQAEKTS